MNNVVIKGRITNDLELKTTPNAVETLQFTVAVDRYAGKGKEKITDFIPCKAWRQNAVFISKYFGKGKEILVSGNLHIDKYDKGGEKRSFSYINVLSSEFCGSRTDSTFRQPSAPEDVAEDEQEEIPF